VFLQSCVSQHRFATIQRCSKTSPPHTFQIADFAHRKMKRPSAQNQLFVGTEYRTAFQDYIIDALAAGQG
jgi:hypothetical protein